MGTRASRQPPSAGLLKERQRLRPGRKAPLMDNLILRSLLATPQMKLRVTSSPNWPLRIYFCALSVRQRRPTRLWPPTEIPRTSVIPKRKICPISTQDRVGFDGVIVWGEPRRGFGRAHAQANVSISALSRQHIASSFGVNATVATGAAGIAALATTAAATRTLRLVGMLSMVSAYRASGRGRNGALADTQHKRHTRDCAWLPLL